VLEKKRSILWLFVSEGRDSMVLCSSFYFCELRESMRNDNTMYAMLIFCQVFPPFFASMFYVGT
jgi:hypothetical protein